MRTHLVLAAVALSHCVSPPTVEPLPEAVGPRAERVDSERRADRSPDTVTAQFFFGDEFGALPARERHDVRVFQGRPWIDAPSPGTIVFAVEGARAPMPAEWIERLRGDAAARGCNAVQIGFMQGRSATTSSSPIASMATAPGAWSWPNDPARRRAANAP